MKKCPKCEINYILDNQEVCFSCKGSSLPRHDGCPIGVGQGLEKEFLKYLIKQGYKEYTSSGMPSTALQYVSAVKEVISREWLSEDSFKKQIKEIISKYDFGGKEEVYGMKGHRTVINALKRFREFLIIENKM